MTGRNLFLLSRHDAHAITWTSEFLHRFGARRDDMEILFFDWDGQPDRGFDPNAFGFEVLTASQGRALGPGDINSLTLSSLQPRNAGALRELVARTGISMEKVCVLVNDDEIQRWSDHLAKHGDWTPGVQDHIDAAVIEMVGQITTYLCPDEPFGRELRRILGDHIRILDIPALPRVVTDPEVYRVLSDRVRPEIEAQVRRSGAIHVMVLSKPRPWPMWRAHMRSLARFALTGREQMVVHVWRRRSRWPLHHMAELWLLTRTVGLMARLAGRGARVEIRSLPSLTRAEYLMTVFRCHALIGAARSGGGAMAEFLRHGKLVFHPAGSVNALINQRGRDIDVPETDGAVFQRIAAMVADGRAAEFGTHAAARIHACEAQARERFEKLFRQDFLSCAAATETNEEADIETARHV